MEEALIFNEMHQQVSAVLMQFGTRIGEAIPMHILSHFTATVK
jgi:hypothetical protein